MNVMTNAKTKLSCISGKILDSKAYKTVERVAVGAGAGLTALSASVMSTSALGEGITITVDEGAVLSNANPFLTPAVTILCIVGGIKLGWSFLKRSFH